MYEQLDNEAFRKKAQTLYQLKGMLDRGLRIPAPSVGLTEIESRKMDKERLIDVVSELDPLGGRMDVVVGMKAEGSRIAYLWETRPRSLRQRILEEMESKLPEWASEFVKWGIVFLAGFGLRWISS